MARIDLLIDLYTKRKNCYADVRRFNTIESIQSRLISLDLLIHSTPPKKRISRGLRYRRLRTEIALLRSKLEVYKRRQLDIGKRSLIIEELLEKTGAQCTTETLSESEMNKMRHTLILMSIIYSKYDDEYLRKKIMLTD
jgi:hypothetical protein